MSNLNFLSFKLWALSVVILFVSCGVNSKAKDKEIVEYKNYIPNRVSQLYKYKRQVILKGKAKDFKTDLSSALEALNKPLSSYLSSNRFVTSITSEGTYIDVEVVNSDGKGICLSTESDLAELVLNGDKFVINVCYTKIQTIKFLPTYLGFKDLHCILAHEIFHTDLYTHVSDSTSCKLMCEVPDNCFLGDQEIAIWVSTVLPNLPEKARKRNTDDE